MTDWEEHYQNQETPWDKGDPSPGLVDFLAEAPLTGRVLVPGCGLGHDVRAISAASPAAAVVGLDIAPSAVEQANQIGRVGAETFQEGDLFALAPDLAGSFDWVWEHTCFCAIDPSMRDDYVRSVREALKPGGQLVGVFYLDPYDEEHRVDDGGPPFGVSLEELESRFGDAFEIVSSWVPARAYEGRESRERMLVMRGR